MQGNNRQGSNTRSAGDAAPGELAGVAGRTPTRALLIGAALSLGLATGCPDKPDTPADAGATASAGGDSVVAERHVELTPEAIKRGKAAFGACMGCHGEKAEGRVGIGPRLASESFLQAASDDFLILNIKEGRAGTTMIPWKASYSDEQVESVVAYIRSLQPAEAATLNETALKGTPESGGKLFRNICSGCHGRSGGGYQETSNGTGIGRKVFLDKASNGFLRHIINAGKSHTAMRGFAGDDPMAVANLSETDIEDIISHLRANAW